jgi:hypothetical protein
MGVRRRDQNVVGGDAEILLDGSPRLVADQPVDAEQIADDEDEFGLAVVEDQTAGVEFVMDMGGGKLEEPMKDAADRITPASRRAARSCGVSCEG